MSTTEVFPFEHRGLKVRGQYDPAADSWTAYFDLPPHPAGFQTVIRTNLLRSPGLTQAYGETPERAKAAAIAVIDEYLGDR